jgi:5-amino-6-(5-phosphoribosylamino)uracil reductase
VIGGRRQGGGGAGEDGAVSERPYVLLSAAMSVDGCIDDRTPDRLILSDAADLDRVDAARAGVDAILVGATTVRRDDPRLLVRSAERVAARVASGRPPQPLRVVLSGSGDLDPAARLFTTGDGRRVVYTSRPERVVVPADVVGTVDPARVLADLRGRGVERLMVEGGTSVHTLFLAAGLVDEIQLVVAPFFVGDPDAPRFVGAGALPPAMRLAEARPMGDHVLLRYLLGENRGRS